MNDPSAKLAEFLELVASKPSLIRSVGTNLGYALAQQGKAAAEVYSSAIGVVPKVDDAFADAFVRGYLACARDVTVSYLDGRKELTATDPQRIAEWVVGKSGALDILRLALERTVVRPTEVETALGSEQQASTVVQDLNEQRLLQPLVGDSGSQALTLLGIRVLEAIDAEQARRLATHPDRATATVMLKSAAVTVLAKLKKYEIDNAHGMLMDGPDGQYDQLTHAMRKLEAAIAFLDASTWKTRDGSDV